jgi:catechol 2,3-dioxygenase-like lactoylglutathione lyase family enzyme
MRAKIVQTIGVLVSGGVFALTAVAQEQSSPPPKIDHILLEVTDLNKSIGFYHGLLGLEVKTQGRVFAMLQSGNVGVFLSSTHWEWDEKRPVNARPGWGMYPHLAVGDVTQTIESARKAGYRITQEPRKYNWGKEAFVADPDGYVWALVSPLK